LQAGGGGRAVIVRRDRGLLAVTIMLDVAFHAGRTSTVSAADIAERAGLARRGIEPLLQALSRSGLLESIRGPRGGYRLGRPRRDIHLDDVVRVATAEEPSSAEDGPTGAMQSAVVDPLWQTLEEEVILRLRAITLEDMIRRAEVTGMTRPLAEPISFSI
jgi:Rrf2 family iron-sulfur cluster assembly transcriptional regulator